MDIESYNYKVVTGYNLYDLVSTVNAEISHGWSPLGAPFHDRTSDNNNSWFQAMVKSGPSQSDFNVIPVRATVND